MFMVIHYLVTPTSSLPLPRLTLLVCSDQILIQPFALHTQIFCDSCQPEMLISLVCNHFELEMCLWQSYRPDLERRKAAKVTSLTLSSFRIRVRVGVYTVWAVSLLAA